MAVTTPIMLNTEGLVIGYTSRSGKRVIVSDISISLEQGELVGVIGINGSGKSTLLRTLANLQPALGGKITLAGNVLSTLKQEELATKLSVVLTNQAISKNLSVAELVSLGRQPYANWLGALTAKDQKAITEALEGTDCLHLSDKKCYELSDGQLQRVLIARAIAQDTPIIILDEPLSHLDLHHKAAILKLLKNLSQTHHKTVIFSSHDIEHIIPLCDKMLVLQNSHCISGAPQALIDNKTLHGLFPSEHITFDEHTGRFSIEK